MICCTLQALQKCSFCSRSYPFNIYLFQASIDAVPNDLKRINSIFPIRRKILKFVCCVIKDLLSNYKDLLDYMQVRLCLDILSDIHAQTDGCIFHLTTTSMI